MGVPLKVKLMGVPLKVKLMGFPLMGFPLMVHFATKIKLLAGEQKATEDYPRSPWVFGSSLFERGLIVTQANGAPSEWCPFSPPY